MRQQATSQASFLTSSELAIKSLKDEKTLILRAFNRHFIGVFPMLNLLDTVSKIEWIEEIWGL